MTNGVEVYTYDPSKKWSNDPEIENLPLIPLPIYKKIFFSGSKSKKKFFRAKKKNFLTPKKFLIWTPKKNFSGPKKKIFDP